MWIPSLACQAWRTSLAQISSPPHSSLPLFPLSLFLSLTCSALTLPTLFLSLHSVLFLATLLSPGSVENVIWGKKSWWLSGFRHHEWVPLGTARFFVCFCHFQLFSVSFRSRLVNIWVEFSHCRYLSIIPLFVILLYLVSSQGGFIDLSTRVKVNFLQSCDSAVEAVNILWKGLLGSLTWPQAAGGLILLNNISKVISSWPGVNSAHVLVNPTLLCDLI